MLYVNVQNTADTFPPCTLDACSTYPESRRRARCSLTNAGRGYLRVNRGCENTPSMAAARATLARRRATSIERTIYRVS